MSTPIAWPEAQRICDIPEIHEALSAFSHDSTEDNAVGLISAVLNAAATFTQGRAAGLEEIIDMLDKFGTLKYRAGCSTIKTGQELLEQAHAYRHMIHEALAALSPTSSDAGKDDALELDAKRYRYMMRDDETALYVALAHLCANDEPIKPQMDAAIDAAIAAQGEGK